MIVKAKADIKITVDGGINDEVAKSLDFADIIVSGSYVVKSDNFNERIELLRTNADKLKTKKRTVRRKIKEENIEKKKTRKKKEEKKEE